MEHPHRQEREELSLAFAPTQEEGREKVKFYLML
jgi:hypothetical protein